MIDTLGLLTSTSDIFLDITIEVSRSTDDADAVAPQYIANGPAILHSSVSPVEVSSAHRDADGRIVDRFSITWQHGDSLTTEYNAGLSLFHDVKDHRLYGLGITPLTEIQALVQTIYGRACIRSGGRTPDAGAWMPALFSAINEELFGPRGPRVYDPRARALLDQYTPAASEHERQQALMHMWFVATKIMLPPLAELYAQHDAVRDLQRPVRQQVGVVRTILDGLEWELTADMLLRLRDNVGFSTSVRARVDRDLYRITTGIRDAVYDFVEHRGLDRRYGGIFDCRRYIVPLQVTGFSDDGVGLQ